MKICMLVTNSLVKDPRVQREALFAHKAGHEVIVVGVWDQNYSEEFISNLPYKVVICPLDPRYREKLSSFVDKAKRFILPIKGMIKVCESLQPDVIHANDFDTLPAAYLAAKKIKQCHVHYDSHEIYSGNPVLVSHPVLRRVLLACEKYIVKRIDTVSSVSNAAADKLAELFNSTRPTVVTNCSYYVKKDQLPQKSDSFDVLYQGRITPFRGYEEFVAAAEFIPKGVNLLVRGYGETKDTLLKMEEERHLENVSFPDPVSIAELIPCAARASVGVILTKPVSDNYKYTVSNKVFECIQARIPVILSDVPEHRYLNETYHIGIIVDDVTPQKVAEAILKMYDDHVFYDECLHNVDAAADVLCWEREGEKLMDCYKRNRN